MPNIAPIAGGLALLPGGGLLGLAIAYVALRARGVSETEGRRGFLAAFYGIVPGMMAGSWAGMTIVAAIQQGHPEWKRAIAGIAAGMLVALLVFVPGWIGGIRWAEARRVSNYAGERAAWGLFYVAMPLTLIGAIAGYLAGYALS